jgi:hypothetical protein
MQWLVAMTEIKKLYNYIRDPLETELDLRKPKEVIHEKQMYGGRTCHAIVWMCPDGNDYCSRERYVNIAIYF